MADVDTAAALFDSVGRAPVESNSTIEARKALITLGKLC